MGMGTRLRGRAVEERLPPLRRMLVIAIELRVDAVAAQCVGETEHALAVLGRVVAVADEDLRHCRDGT